LRASTPPQSVLARASQPVLERTPRAAGGWEGVGVNGAGEAPGAMRWAGSRNESQKITWMHRSIRELRSQPPEARGGADTSMHARLLGRSFVDSGAAVSLASDGVKR